ncbi:MAG: LacI family DNA-binding transcriptional regulator [Acidimicrobiales bacterium]
MERVTLSDVAAAADVHVSTASRALNEATRSVVKPDTVTRILDAAERLGYRPHALARGLRTSQTLSIGVVIPDLENPLFGPIIAGIEAGLAADGYSVLITASTSHHEDEAVRSLVDRHVDGIILASATRTDPVVERLAKSGPPTVLANRLTENVDIPAIIGDDQLGIRLVVDHLIEMGHTKIGHLSGPEQMSTGIARRRAFEAAMRDYGFPVLVEDGTGFQVEPGATAAARLLEREPSITALVAANDLIGLGAYRAVRTSGRQVGPDVAIAGYNDVGMLDLIEPAMTAVHIAYRHMGAKAAEVLLQILQGEDAPTTTLLEPTLSIRASTRPA